eukprot:3048000-Pleurochrysis_carterae.AAC.2
MVLLRCYTSKAGGGGGGDSDDVSVGGNSSDGAISSHGDSYDHTGDEGGSGCRKCSGKSFNGVSNGGIDGSVAVAVVTVKTVAAVSV